MRYKCSAGWLGTRFQTAGFSTRRRVGPIASPHTRQSSTEKKAMTDEKAIVNRAEPIDAKVWTVVDTIMLAIIFQL